MLFLPACLGSIITFGLCYHKIRRMRHKVNSLWHKTGFAAPVLSHGLPGRSLQVSFRKYAVFETEVIFDVAEFHFGFAAGLQV